ncbi:peritrophin-1-like [Artemia franciscana]|uniref:Chitin-binding type-2 domain-containing protein n=2 Tax=Artemia franciscana TaxID=6661 RepID=A0AA88HB91_ARTSF|nr:hypothetical protein QYM36_014983 [Artemia franciscana]
MNIIFLTFIVLAATAKTSNSICIEITCPSVDDNESVYYLYPGNCTQFIQCSNGLATVHKCPPGLVFDDSLNVCNFPDNVIGACGNNQNRSTTLEAAAESTLEELAIGQDRIENPASAVKNTSMSSTTLVSTTSQLSQEEKCPEEDGPYAVHIPHDSNCTMFYKCFKGTPVLQLCPSGLWFNAVLEVCDYPEQSGCVMGKSSS